MRKITANNKGIALVMVLWLLVILTVISFEMVVSARGDVGAVRNFKEDRQAYFLAYAGIQMAMNEILVDSKFHYKSEDGVRFGWEEEDFDSMEFSSRSGVKLGEGLVSYFIEDENSKLNLNELALSQGNMMLFLQTLFPDGDVDIETIADSVLDWVDIDDLHRVNGAESDYYKKLDPPYSAGDSEFVTLSELMKVKGVTKELYETLSEFLTVYPRISINPNTASGVALIVSGMPVDQVELLLEQRESQGYINAVAKSDIFTISSTGRMAGSRVVHHLKAVVAKSNGRLVILNWADDHFEPQNVKIGGG